MSYNNIATSDPKKICNLFSEYFQSVFEPTDVDENYDLTDIPDSNTGSALVINNIEITVEELIKELHALDATKGAGVDGIPPIFFKNIAGSISMPLHMIFNRCLHEGVFPTIWKTARIVPVYKGGKKSDIENYRPISILPTLSKLFERLVHNHIYPLLHNIIIEQQHGFVQRRSTTTNLLIYVTHLFESLDQNIQTDSIYTDFRKAFDRVDHKKLLEKLFFNGIRGNLWRWFKSYITNRTQKVIINGHESDIVYITSGVPQGSILGPLLFIIFINDIYKCFKHSSFLLYADDLKIYHNIKNISDHVKLQEDLDRFSDYCYSNKLILSLNKCKAITFTKKRASSTYSYVLCGERLETVESIKDLGVTLDTKLHLNTHIDNIISKAYKLYGFTMRSCKGFTRSSTFLHIYKSLIRSQLEYAVPIWNPYYKKYIEALEIVQKKFLRSMHYKCYRSRISYNQLLMKYNLSTLEIRRTQLEMMMLYDLCRNRFDCIALNNKLCYRIPTKTHCRRSHRLFATAPCRTNAGKRSPLYRLTDVYNKYFVSIDLMFLSAPRFKKGILELLTANV